MFCTDYFIACDLAFPLLASLDWLDCYWRVLVQKVPWPCPASELLLVNTKDGFDPWIAAESGWMQFLTELWLYTVTWAWQGGTPTYIQRQLQWQTAIRANSDNRLWRRCSLVSTWLWPATKSRHLSKLAQQHKQGWGTGIHHTTSCSHPIAFLRCFFAFRNKVHKTTYAETQSIAHAVNAWLYMVPPPMLELLSHRHARIVAQSWFAGQQLFWWELRTICQPVCWVCCTA